MAVMAIATVALLASNALAQDATAPAPAAANVTAAPQLSAGASQVLQLAKAKVSDETIVAFIKNSGDSYTLSADQIIYLQQQGVSSTVLNLMLTQPKSSTATVAATAPAAAPAVSTATVAPTTTTVTYVPTTYYYSQPAYYPAYYGYGWGCSPAVSLSFGWGGRWGGGGWHGGGHGGHR